MEISKEFYLGHTPLEWQERFLEIYAKSGKGVAHAEPGCGKTFAAIMAYRLECMRQKRLIPCLIFSPLITLRNWKDEFAKFSNIPQGRILLVTGTKKQKLKALDNPDDRVYITNYETVRSDEVLEVMKEKAFEFVIGDEWHYLKTHNAQGSKRIYNLTKHIEKKIMLTGTPLLNNAADLFMQYKIFDNGETFGDNFYAFRAKYMEDENARWAHQQNHFPKWVTKKSMYEELNSRMYQYGLRVLKKDCIDLPPLIRKTIECPMSTIQKRHYKQMKRDFITFIEEGEETKAVTAQVAAVKAIRLMQICAGHMITEDGDTIDLGVTPKYTACAELLESIMNNPDNQCILWCAFKQDYITLENVCKDLNLSYVHVTGQQSSTEKFDNVDTFNNGEARVIIGNRRALGIGVNLVGAAYSIIWSRNFNLADELQSEARNYRRGSEKHVNVTQYSLVCEDSIEGHVVENLQNKKDLSNNVVDLVKHMK